MAVVVLGQSKHRSLAELANSGSSLRVLHTEASRALHTALAPLSGYVCSEFFGEGHRNGEIVNGVQHQDLMGTSFAEGSFDLVISADVFEHIPRPHDAHREVFRILAPGGRHVMTVPFERGAFRDHVLAKVESDGTITHLETPEYHGDTLRPEGILAYRRFGIESLVRCEEIGFQPLF